MKLVYHITSLYNPGGMERVVLNKATWFLNHDWDVLIVTTDQKGRPPFYSFPEGIRLIDLGINYSDDKGKNVISHMCSYLKKRHLHKVRLSKLLLQENADIVDTLYPGESSFIPSINDNSKKIIELHQNKFFHRQYANKGLKGLIDRARELLDVLMVRKFDKFVVLTEEDRQLWGNIENMVVIPNAALVQEGYISDCSAKRVIAVGRLDYQKSFDRLIDAWKIVCDNSDDWYLDIYGQGEWEPLLRSKILGYNISDRCHLKGVSSSILGEYSTSSIIVMSSHYEGLPMVMIEAMSCGLPAVSFDFKCGPKDIIQSGVNGILVQDGDIDSLAMSLLELIDNPSRIKEMSKSALLIKDKYSETCIMNMWEQLYYSLINNEGFTN